MAFAPQQKRSVARRAKKPHRSRSAYCLPPRERRFQRQRRRGGQKSERRQRKLRRVSHASHPASSTDATLRPRREHSRATSLSVSHIRSISTATYNSIEITSTKFYLTPYW